jgi:hypothetical protein
MIKCINCKKEISSKATRCKSCARKGNLNPNFGSHMFYGESKNGFGKDNSNYRHGETLKKHYCIDCNKKISYNTWSYGNKRCKSCEIKRRIKEGTFCGSKKGKEHSGFINGRGYEPYSSDFTEKLKELIRQRDNYICQGENCSMTEEEHIIVYGRVLEIHHIDHNKQNCNEDNLVTLCKQCNIRANKNINYWQDFYKNKVTNKKLKENIK